MVQILYILSCSFEKVFIYKPETSRPANSEKYLVCLYFKDNLSLENKDILLNIIEKWQKISENLSENDSVILQNIKTDNFFIKNLSEYNEKYIENQLFYLNNTIKLAQSKIEKEKYYEIIQNQVKTAINWCNKYGIEINTNSIYYKKNIS
jgi:cap1 methyltransferase